MRRWIPGVSKRMKRFSVGVIGGGQVASVVHIPLLSCVERVKLLYVADVNDTRLLAGTYNIDSFRAREDLSKLPDCDIAVLAIPVGVRTPYIEEFSRRSTSVFSEKPFATDVESHERYLQLVKNISCDFMSTCFSSVNQLKSLVESEVLGRISRISISEGSIVGPTGKGADTYRSSSKLAGGGVLMERGSQTLAQLSYMLDNCEIAVEESKVVTQDDLDIDVSTRLKASGAQNCDISFAISIVKPLGYLTRVTFEKAEVTFDHYRAESHLRIAGLKGSGAPAFELKPDGRWATNMTQAYYLRWKRFLDQIDGVIPLDSRRETSIQTTRLMEEIYEKSGGEAP